MFLLNDLSLGLGYVFGVEAAGEGAVKKLAKALIDHSFMRKGKGLADNRLWLNWNNLCQALEYN